MQKQQRETEAIKTWFATPVTDTLTRRDIVSVRQIELAATLPATTLSKFLTGDNATFPSKHINRLVPVLMLLGYNPIKSKHQIL